MTSTLLFIFGFVVLLQWSSSFKICRSTVSHPLLKGQTALSRRREIQYSSSESDENYDEKEFTQKQILKEETEAPFRKVRIFLYISLLAAAGLGSLVSITKVIALSAGAKAVSSIPGAADDVYLNLFVNLAGIPVLGSLWKRELDSQKSRLQRIQKGGSLAGLKLRYVSPIDGDSSVIKLSDLRRDRGIEKRVVIVAATKELLKSSLATSVGVGQDLSNNDLVIVPLSIDTTSPYGDNSILEDGYSLSSIEPRELLGLDGEGEEVLGKVEHIWSPVALASWNKVIKSEMATALKQQPEALLKGVTIVIKKNGRVGSRRFGVPLWESLVEDVANRKEMGMDVRNI